MLGLIKQLHSLLQHTLSVMNVISNFNWEK
uniref:Uncharacterized protein n=1 Tax=Anguilla anguilla TaxID=7936 RepID=A0A0E9RS84_ANGAN